MVNTRELTEDELEKNFATNTLGNTGRETHLYAMSLLGFLFFNTHFQMFTNVKK